VILVSACSKTPTQPTKSSVSASVTAPTPVVPTNGAQLPYVSQPVMLVVSNAVVTESTDVTYEFAVATDDAFSNKVFTNASVAQGSGGQTSVPVGNLNGGTDYFWHVRVTAGRTIGTFSTTFKFTIRPRITIDPPNPISPANMASTNGWPTLTVANAHSTGAASLIYRFEISPNAAFSSLATPAAMVSEGANQTSFTPPADPPPPANGPLYWRVTVIDQSNAVSSASSAVRSFVPAVTRQSQLAAQLGLTLWPGAQPSGTPGRAVLGDGWDPRTIVSPIDGTVLTVPTLVLLQLFDCMDRGFDPQGAIDWMNSHGYPNQAGWYPAPQVIGVPYVYIYFKDGKWNLFVRVGG
jgi:hypothetical protein